MNDPLYHMALGAYFSRLAPQVRALHTVERVRIWRGSVDVEHGSSVLSRMIARIFNLPPVGIDQPILVRFTPAADGETWHRVIGGGRFVSHQTLAAPHQIYEQIGPARLLLRLFVDQQSLSLQAARLWVLGLPMPRFLTPLYEPSSGRTPVSIGLM